MKTIILVRSSFPICQLEILVPYVKCKHVCPKSNFGETIVLMRLASVFFLHFREMKIDCWTTRHLLCEKNVK